MVKPRLLLGLGLASALAPLASLAGQSAAPLFRLPTLKTGSVTALLVLDLNGDGRQDIAAASGSSTTVSILLSQGNGSFAVGAVLSCGGYSPVDIAVADIDSDGRPDLVVARTGGQGLLVFRGLGGGQFTLIDTLTADAYFGVEVGDFDEDGRADLVCANYYTPNLTLFLRDAHGGFAPGEPFEVLGQPRELAVADFDADGHLDVVTTHQAASLSVLSGDGEGTLSAPVSQPVPTYASGLTVADVNADTFPDILTCHDTFSGQQPIHLLLGQDGGGFTDAGTVATGPSPVDLAIGDLDEDGHLDLVSVNAGNDSTFTYLGHGDGSFSFEFYSFFSFSGDDIALGDFDGDGDLDLAEDSPSDLMLVIALGRGDGGFDVNPPVSGAGGTWRAVGDFDEDGRPDIVSTGTSTVIVSLGQGGPVFAQQPSITVGSDLRAAVVDDFDADGHQDIAAASLITGTVPVLLGDGDGGFALAGSVAAGPSPQLLAAGDFDGDGRRDLAVVSVQADSVKSLLGTGDGGFVPGPTVFVGVSAQELAAADFDGDGRSDLAIADYSTDSVHLLRGQADGALLPYGELLVHGAPQALTAGDLNGDGHVDLATGNSSTSTLSAFSGLGDGSFGPGVSWAVGAGPQVVRIIDLDGDGRRDLLSIDLTGTLSVLRGGPNGLVAPVLYHTVVYSDAGLVADFDGDGWPDVLVEGSFGYNEPRRLLQNQAGSEGFPWTNLGQPLAGVAGLPLLVGTGTLLPGSSGQLALEQAAPFAPAVLFASTEQHPMPFKGGVLVPLPVLLTVAMATNGEGELTLPWLACPPGLPSGSLYLQLAIADASAVAGVSLSNAVRADLP